MASNNQSLDARAFALFERSLKRDRKIRKNWIRAEAGSDAKLRGRTLQLLASDESGPDILMTGGAVAETYVDETPPDKIGVYKIGEKLGQGGMGAVYRGERDIGDFDHAVAIKLIKPGIISDNLKDRFAHEQQVLAGFSHPNIAHLYDGGTTDEGAPYIIMELIDGVSITDWARQNGLNEKQCLDIFKTACQAVAYAHQNLIIHRDLTPSNVLVTKEGIVKLIDFGIAKPYDEDAAAQDMIGSLGSLSFTPGFAAPERSKGAAANTLSDIYSLGKLLDNVLPEGTMNTDLQAIYDKATALMPDDRYANVNGLIDDIDHYQTGYPVSATLGGIGYQLKKFIKRNSLVTALGSIALIGLVGGLFVATSLYHQAETARQEADNRFGQVRQLANAMMFDVYDEIARVPGTIEGRLELVKSAQKYLDSLSLDHRATFGLRQEAAKGHIQLARIVGSPKGASLFDIAKAKTHLGTAEDLLNALYLGGHDDATTLFLFARLYHRKAEISIDPDSKLDRALTEIETSKEYYARAIDAEPDNFELRLEAIGAFASEATIISRQNRNNEAARLAKANIERINKLLTEQPNNREVLRVRSGALRGHAEILSGAGKFEQTLEPLEQAIQDLDFLIFGERFDFDLTRGKMIAHWRRAFSLANLGRNTEAIGNYEKAIALAKLSIARNPDDPDTVTNLVIIQGEVYLPYSNLRRFDDAENALDYSLKHYQSEYKKNPNSGRVQRTLLVQHYLMTDFFTTTKDDVKRCYHLAQLQKFVNIMVNAKTLDASDKAELDTYFKSSVSCQ